MANFHETSFDLELTESLNKSFRILQLLDCTLILAL